jgi:uncharacterized membrane protein
LEVETATARVKGYRMSIVAIVLSAATALTLAVWILLLVASEATIAKWLNVAANHSWTSRHFGRLVIGLVAASFGLAIASIIQLVRRNNLFQNICHWWERLARNCWPPPRSTAEHPVREYPWFG